MIDLDHHATTPVRPEVWDAMRPYAIECYGNPNSAHAVGRKARKALDDARETVAALLDARPDEVVFTSGATEANNLAVFGLAGTAPGLLLSSPVEHPCVIEPLKHLARQWYRVEMLPVDSAGIVISEGLTFPAETRLVACMLVNHETGAVQPVRELAAKSKVAFHCDAAQAVGKRPVSFRELGVTTLSLSAHKFGGPKGVGALLVRHGTKLAPQLHGGHQQQGRRPGTESAPLAVGLATALQLADREREANSQKVARLRMRFLEELSPAKPFTMNSPEAGSPYVVNVSFPGCRGELLLMKLDLAGVACSTGSACSSGSLLPSPVLLAMGVADDVLRSALRFSFGPSLSEADIVDAARRVATCVRDLRASGVG
jgi:cysteine desulfurase